MRAPRLPRSLALLLFISLPLSLPLSLVRASPTELGSPPSVNERQLVHPKPFRHRSDDDDDDPEFPDTLPSAIGFIFPRPSAVSVGQNITLGYLDPLPDPANASSTLPGLVRQITPLLTLPNRTVVTLPSWGSLSMDPPYSPFYPPVYPEGWCAVILDTARTRLASWVVGEGLEGSTVHLELNITWGLPTYTGPDHSTNCTSPARLYRSYFVAHALSISSSPAPSPSPSTSTFSYFTSPTSPSTTTVNPTTTLTALYTAIPPWPSLPRSHAADPDRRSITVQGAVLALGVVCAFVTGLYLVRRKRRVGMGEG